jgi:predicted SAM-dependent methyltransferase
MFLDFGCGAGEYLNRMRDAGYSTIGMDFSSHALGAIERNGHKALPVSSEGWARLAPASIDFVRMNHVIEHLYDARQALTMLHAKMKPGARLHIAVPNPSGLSAKVFRRYWHGLDCPRHVILYPPESLSNLLTSVGFKVERLLHEPLTKDHIRSWSYFFQGKGLAKRSNPDSSMHKPLWRLLSMGPSVLAAFTGHADRYHIVATR